MYKKIKKDSTEYEYPVYNRKKSLKIYCNLLLHIYILAYFIIM